MAAAVLAKAYDWRFAVTAVVTVGIYGVLTFSISDWRIVEGRLIRESLLSRGYGNANESSAVLDKGFVEHGGFGMQASATHIEY